MSKRKAAEEMILKYVEKILPKSGNKEMYEEKFKQMSDKQFDDYMKKLRDGEDILFLVSPNLSKSRISVERNLAIAKELGHDFFQRLELTDQHTGAVYKTDIKFLVVDVPLRRQCQMLNKKVSIPRDNDNVDVLTGQYTGQAGGGNRGGRVSFPELQTLKAHGLEKTIEELIKFRGGDEEAFRAMNKALIDNGSVALDSINTNSRVKSTETLSIYLKAAHLDNTL